MLIPQAREKNLMSLFLERSRRERLEMFLPATRDQHDGIIELPCLIC
jgi:hypothetical protein